MANAVNRIGMLTSGGDSQGMNAAVYAVARYALGKGIEVFLIQDGYQGLIDGDIRAVVAKDLDAMIHRGGTIIGTSRCPEMRTPEGRQKAHANLVKYGIDGLVVIGGDGSFQGAKLLTTEFGVLTMGIPGTIDNDLAYTDYTLGFDSAVNVCINAIKNLRDTMTPNDRTCIVEVMGRNCGDMALYAGIASGAEIILVPEVEWTVDQVVAKLKSNHDAGKVDNIIVISEGAGSARQLLADINERMDINIRDMVLGHLQRGGDASLFDRMLGLRMGQCAVDCLLEGKTSRVVGIQKNKIIDLDMIEALAQIDVLDKDLYDFANQLVKF